MAKESVIRLMTRLADKYGAVNLSQGFPDEPPPYDMVWAAISASLGGTKEGVSRLQDATLSDVIRILGRDTSTFLGMKIKDVLAALQNPRDVFNQYSYPFGLPELRQAVADYTMRFQGFWPDPETEITVTAGVTEGTFSSLAAVLDPGDEVIICQPFHEMYPQQAAALRLRPRYVTLRDKPGAGAWTLDEAELKEAFSTKPKAFILNSPHNPTGKVFIDDELLMIANLCKENDALVISDEIYEHFTYENRRHRSIGTIQGMRERTIILNGISKTGMATGWRVAWVISPARYTPAIRGFHDTSVLQAPTPMQKGAEALLGFKDRYFEITREAYLKKRNILAAALQDAGFAVCLPEGSYYLFASFEGVPCLRNLSATDAAMHLIEAVGVASVPGDNFYAVGSFGDKYLRFAFCKNNKTLEEAAHRLKKAL